MKRISMGLVVAVLLILASCTTSTGGGVDGLTLYTQMNLWEYKNIINVVNYSVERKIPVNTEITIRRVRGAYIYFHENARPNLELTIVNKEAYSGVSTEDLTRLFFGPEPVDLNAFSPVDRRFIEDFDGFWHPGVSKKAVIVGRGFPPIHRTPNLNDNTWIYWRNKWSSRTVGFVDGKTALLNGKPIEPR